jgi:hypothetical protein
MHVPVEANLQIFQQWVIVSLFTSHFHCFYTPGLPAAVTPSFGLSGGRTESLVQSQSLSRVQETML